MTIPILLNLKMTKCHKIKAINIHQLVAPVGFKILE